MTGAARLRLLLGTVLLLLPAAARAQEPTPLAPALPNVQRPGDAPPAAPGTPPPSPGAEPPGTGAPAVPLPDTEQAPTPQGGTPPAAPGQPPAAGAPNQPPQPAPPPPNVWLPKQVAELVGLDKVSARATRLTVRVGQSATFGSLTITVRACEIRPPDQAADATAFLDVTDKNGGGEFHGWMVLSDPSVSMFQNPVYDVRLAGCHD